MKTHFVCLFQFALSLSLMCLAGSARGQVNEQVLYSFGGSGGDGRSPSRLAQGADGWLYGSTTYGGNNGAGTLFKINPDGTGYSILHSFTTNNVSDGAYPSSDIVVTADGWLCGVTPYGGANGAGSVYRIRTSGTGFMLIHSFTLHKSIAYGPTEGPRHLIQGRDGSLYGVIEGATGGFAGAVFKLGIGGGGYSEIHMFGSSIPDLMMPSGGLVQGADGVLYGTAFAGTLTGTNYTGGGVFRMNPDGSGYSVIYLYGHTSEAVPYPSSYAITTLAMGRDGALYGTTVGGGTNALGTIYRLNTNGTEYTQLHSFDTRGVDHNSVYPSALIQGKDGAFYGTTLSGGFGNAFRMSADGADYQVLWWFSSESGLDSRVTDSGVIQGRDGALYGVSQGGGDPGYGTVFKLTLPTGACAAIKSFGETLPDGGDPESALVQGSDGTLYGTTYAGGSGTSPNGAGTIFKVNPSGLVYASIYQFGDNGSTGRHPSGLVLGADGGLYGGASGGSSLAGVLYRINTDGTGYQLLHSFTTNSNDGRYPQGAPIQGRDGALYGITSFGGNFGTNIGPPGFGTVYKVRTNGLDYAVLYRFSTNVRAGAYPSSSLVQASDGALYGAGLTGSNGWGFVYRLNTDGTGYKVLYNFQGAPGDGSQPHSLIQGRDGLLYGTTMYGGGNAAGTVFTMKLSGEGYTQIYAFSTNGADGQVPEGIMQGRDGMIYGTTRAGGKSGLGSVFKIGTDGAGYEVVYSFVGSEGSEPLVAPMQGADGALYGSLSGGGPTGNGSVFRLAVTAAQFASADLLPNKRFQFLVNGGALCYRIDASSDLRNWTPLTNLLNAVGPVRITDPDAVGFRQRFYRVIWTPFTMGGGND
jgi:uncharacterized repeat protein (TIGR03803 family)